MSGLRTRNDRRMVKSKGSEESAKMVTKLHQEKERRRKRRESQRLKTDGREIMYYLGELGKKEGLARLSRERKLL